jgi:hypothetical protein
MAAMILTLLSIFVIAPVGALAFDRPLYGNWIWHINPGKARDYKSDHESRDLGVIVSCLRTWPRSCDG